MADTPFPLPRATRQTDVLEGDGTTTVFGPFLFKIFDIEDVEVQTRLDGATFFSVAAATVAKTSADAFADFTVTFAAAPAATTEFLVIGRREPMRQLAVTKGGSIAGAELEKELSKQAVALSEYRRDLDRAYVADVGGAGRKIAAIPAGHVVKADASGNLVGGGSVDDITAAAAAAAASAAASATSAGNSATSAAGSATAADGSAGAAAASATAAAGSATSAGNSATAAAGSATAADGSADAAAASATSAAGSATAASGSASASATSATNAGNSATAAAGSATAAAGSATSAATSATNAANSATSASSSATVAAASAADAIAAAAGIVTSKFNTQVAAAAATISASVDFIEVGGLVYQEIDGAAAHPRLVSMFPNPSIDPPAPQWSQDGDWTISGGAATKTSGTGGSLIHSADIKAGRAYMAVFITGAITNGPLLLYIGGIGTQVASVSGNGTHFFVASGNGTQMFLYGPPTATAEIQWFALYELPSDAFASADGAWWAQPFPDARELDFVSMFGAVADGADSLDPGAPTLVRGAWVTATAYAVNDLVWSGGLGYRCLVAHTSGTFATDLAAAKWVVGAFSGTDNTAAFARMLIAHEATGLPMLVPPGKYRMLNPSSTVDSAYLTLSGQVFDLILNGTLLIDEDGTAGKGYNLFKSSNFATVAAYNERKLFRIKGTGGFRGRWSHKPGGNTPNARAHILAIAGYENVHLEDFFYEDIAGSFSRALKLNGVYANNVRGERCAKGGLRFLDTNDARVTNNKLRHHGDDAIDLHAYGTKLRSRIYIAGNQLFDTEQIIALGAREISVIGNQCAFSKSGAIYVGGRAGSEGDNAALMIVVSGNIVSNPLMASADGSTLADHDGTQAAITVGSVPASWRAGDYNGSSVNDPLSGTYYQNIDLDTTNVPQGGSIEVYGNPIRHTRPNATNFSEYGEGLIFHQDGWINPAVTWNKRVPNGVRLISDIENFNVVLNVSGFRSGAAILFTFLQSTEALRNWSFRNGRVSGVVRDCLVAMSHSFWDAAVQAINFPVHFDGLQCDLDPYHVSTARGSATGGNWSAAAATAVKNYGLRLASMRGFTLRNSSFKNCYAPAHGDTNYEYGLYRANVIYGTRAVAGHSTSNFGVGDVPWSNDQFDFITVASVPSAGAGTYDVAPVVVRREGTITLADDTATSITPPRPQGTVRIVSNANGAVADFAYDVSTGAIVAVGASGASVTLGTAALTGTTGTDVKANYAAVSDGKIYIENRLGSSRSFRYLFLDG